MGNTNTLTAEQFNELISLLKVRFEKNKARHKNIEWSNLFKKLETYQLSKSTNATKLWSLYQMEHTGGEPDVMEFDPKTEEYYFVDCSVESPKGRRSLCYDDDALKSRKENKPADSALNMTASMGIELLTETQYRALQQLGNFDIKTSSWVQTPTEIRKLGGALFCDRRYNHVFVYHNGSESYYAVRGFRGLLRV